MKINWKDLAPGEKSALVSECVFGASGLVHPEYASEMAAGWLVVEKLTTTGFKDKDGYELYCKISYAWFKGGLPAADAYVAFDWKETGDRHPLYFGVAATVAEAICIAALRVLGHEVEL